MKLFHFVCEKQLLNWLLLDKSKLAWKIQSCPEKYSKKEGFLFFCSAIFCSKLLGLLNDVASVLTFFFSFFCQYILRNSVLGQQSCPRKYSKDVLVQYTPVISTWSEVYDIC
jgi:hypothetical protein